MANTIIARGDGCELVVVNDARGVMWELTGQGFATMRDMWRDQGADEVVAYIQRCLPLEIDLTRGTIRDTTQE